MSKGWFLGVVAMTTVPLLVSFPSGVHVVFVFVRHEGQAYAVYLDRENDEMIGIARLDWDHS
jgi:hypothetical protein